ncbi:MAG: leucine-rich repeat protein [Clostridia bacterium]|nr:leucine-rich repeat protein [Clostridia bacterium]
MYLLSFLFHLPDTVSVIGSFAFYNCTQLKTVSFGKSLKNIKSNAFFKCNNLRTIQYNGTPQEWVYVFKNFAKITKRAKVITL